MKGKTKTILTVVIAILVFSIAAVGTVTFLKDDGEASAAEEGTMNVLPVTGSDGEETVNNEEQNQSEELEGEEQGENVGESFDDVLTDGEDETTGITGNQGTGEGEQLEPEATTIEQERLVSTTLNWSGIRLSSTIGETGINYTKLAYIVKYYQVVNKDEINLINTEAGFADYGTTVEVSGEQIKENCPEVGYKFDETSNSTVVITENVNGNVIEIYYIKNRFDLKVEYEYENGEPAVEPFEKDFEYEEEYSVESPKIEGYTPDKEIVEGQMPGEDTTITVTYKPNTDVSYTVKYLEKGTNKVLADEEIRTEKTFNETYTETAKTVIGYTVDETEKTITLDVYGKEVIFYYTVNQYTATFIPNNGEENIEKTQDYGTELTAPEDPVKEGYTFVGWDKEVPETMPAEDTKYEAQWEVNQYTVTYYVDGEQYGEVETYDYGTELTQKEEPSKEGYTFSGWDVTLPETMPAENIEVKGTFTANTDVSYTVKYLEKGTNKVLADEEIRTEKTFNETYTETAKPVTGYTVDETEKTITLDAYGKEVIFYYTANTDVSYVVKYLEKGTNKVLADEEIRTEKTFNETYTETAKTVIGYIVDETEKIITLDAYGKEVIFYYTVNQYTATFIPNNGEENIEKTQDYGTELTAPEDPVKEGYTFIGWDKEVPETMPAEDTKYEAQWEVNQYTVTYYVDGEQYGEVETYDYGTELTQKEEPSKEGYTFSGWDVTLPETMPAEDIEVKGTFTANTDVSYTVKYLEKGTNKVLADEEIRTEKTFNETYTETAKPVTGYTVDETEKTITLDAYGKEVIFYYTANTDVSYVVKYLEKGTNKVLADEEIRTEKTFNETYTETAKTVIGYTVDETEKIITLDAYGKEVIFYYTVNQYSYKIEYYYSNVLDESKTVSSKADFGTVIDSYEDKVIDGYVFEKVENKPLTISTNVEENVMKVYYIKDEFGYTIEYYYDNIKDDSKTENETAVFGDVIDTYTDKNKEGYRFDKTENKPLTITSNAKNNVMKVYYVKDNIAYTVEYYKDGENAPFATSNNLTAVFGSTITNVDTEINKPEGYALEKVENLPLTITAVAANNVIKVYYAKPNISIEKTASDVTPNVGDTITYTITLTNSGKVNGTTTVTDTLPEGLTFVSADNGGTYLDGTVTWSNIEVPANGAKVVTVTVTVNTNKVGATITNTASFSEGTPTTSEIKTDSETITTNEITATEIGATQGEYGKDSVNVVLVMDLSSSMNKLVYTFHECTHEHEYRNTYWGTEEYCPENCKKQQNGSWGYNTSETRLSIAKRAAQSFVNKIYTDADSKVTVTVVTFNDKIGNSKYVGTKVLTFGNNNKTATNANYSQLVTEIGNIDIGTATSGYGTHIKAALDTTYSTIYGTNGLSTTYPNNSNVVIFLGDGDPTGTSYSGFGDNSEENIKTSANTIKNAGATIYSIGFGSDATNTSSTAYRVLKNMSSNDIVYTANDSVALAEVFTNLEGQLQPDKPATTDGGIITINLTKNLVVNGTNPIVVEYNGTQLFSCTGTAEEPLSKYNLAYNAETKTLTFDINAYNANPANTTKITNNNVTIRYIIER